ncbi:MAG: shikimate dehydrogenase [Methanobacteriota archaeon]|nr:MAG: shikimate dehydrogenase [Euryarchaeota archaeon]
MMTLVVASLVERGVAGVSRSSKRAFDAGADLVEVRLDHIRNIDRNERLIHEARAAAEGPAIATLRSAGEGGRSQSKGKARHALLREIADAGFEYIDIESARDGPMLEQLMSSGRRSRTIASFHFAKPATKERVRVRLKRGLTEADVSKVAMPCENAAQAVVLAELALELAKEPKPFALMGMGIQGQLTRACASGMGSKFVYACLEGHEAAPGQLEIRTQTRLLDKDRVVLGLIGHPVSHSVSKPMQEAALRSAGMSGIYLPLDIPPRSMNKAIVDTLFDIGFDGLNVTVPNKHKAYLICDTRRSSAEASKAVNTLWRRRRKIVGDNTDLIGFGRLLESKKIRVADAETLVVGAGGAARAACRVLSDKGANVTVAARRAKPAEETARMCRGRHKVISSLRAPGESYDLVVNATPIGTAGTADERSNLPVCVLRNARVFVDLVYNPSETLSMRIAKSHGCKVHGGLEMLVRQGEAAFEIWTGISPDVAKMRQAARKAVSR